MDVGQGNSLIHEINTSVSFNEPTQKVLRALSLSLAFYAPGNSIRFTNYPGFGFQRRRGTKPASFWLTGETDSGAHTRLTSKSTFGSAVRTCFSPRDRG